MTADAPHFKIRLPRTLKAKLDQASRLSGLSITAEIVYRLEDSFASIETKMLEHRFDELDTVNREIDDLQAFIDKGDADKQAIENARTQLQSLQRWHELLIDQVSHLTMEVSKQQEQSPPKRASRK
ncbi:Arc family DNA-binding protein [Stenotrophomonas indicatrix]|uniref:Arc family DNA-binding protein n=1 Tax=Stenotrophomonas indicatrix TaxID=2045451 RepID=UPI001CBE3354|nr:Arc family DNA-binding protein [Stenotrophomonas indicatrix]